MRSIKRSKFLYKDPKNTKAKAMCDLSGFYVDYDDLVKQYEYNADGLYWTGLWVSSEFADEPNPQGLVPKAKPDPIPLDHPKPLIIKFKDN